MNNSDLKGFAIENISLQIKNTIGNEEELEAWQEMEDFFKDGFENVIKDIQMNTRLKKIENSNTNIEETKLNAENKGEDKKLDMWED